MELQTLQEISLSNSFFDSPDGYGPMDALAAGSRNILAIGAQQKGFLGLSFLARGARVLMQTKNTYGGLEDYVSGTSRTVGSITAGANVLTDAGNPFVIGDDGKAIQLINSSSNSIDQIGYLKYVAAGQVTLFTDSALTIPMTSGTTFAGNLSYTFGTLIRGAGSIFSHIASTLFYNGAGQVMYNGSKITGATASSTLKLLLSRNGSYTASNSGPYSAGLTQTSAPSVFVKTTPSAGFTGLLNSPALALKIAVLRRATGARSIASPSSDVFSCSGQTVVAVVPTMQSGGSDWVFFATQAGFGGIGPYQRLPVSGQLQVPETYFTRIVTDAVTNSTRTLTSATANFTASDVGKQIVLSGGGSLTTTIQSVTNSTTVIMTAPATWSSSGNTAVVTAMIALTNPRTVTDLVANGTTTVTSATAAWTQADVGKQVVINGGSGALAYQTRTIATVTNATDVVLNSLVAASTGATATIVDVNGTLRAIELEWQDGDLTSEFAWIDDYPPPAGTHCAALNNVTLVGGCYADATADPTSSGPGTCIAQSLQNFPESFRPTDLLYLPEPIVGMLGRQSDNFMLVGCRDSTHQVQYVGGSDGPACVLTTMWADQGIAHPHAWCLCYGIPFVMIAKGKIATLNALGQPDSTFMAPIAESIKDWEPENTVLDFHPNTNQFVVSNGAQAYGFCFDQGGWSSVLPYSDFATGNALSAVNSQKKMKIVIEGNGAHPLFTFNEGAGSTVTAMSHWFEASGRTKTIWECAERIQVDSTSTTPYVSVHRNFRVPTDNAGAITNATNTLTTATAGFFTAADVGSYVLILGAGAAGAPLLARIKTFNSATSVNLGDPDPTVPIVSAANRNAGATVSSAFFIIAKKIYARTPRYKKSNVFRPKRVHVREAYAYAIGITIPQTTGNVQALGATLYGIPDGQSAGITA